MGTDPIDYTAEQVAELRAWFEQFVVMEERCLKLREAPPESLRMFRKILHILRGVDDAKQGTAFISARGPVTHHTEAARLLCDGQWGTVEGELDPFGGRR